MTSRCETASSAFNSDPTVHCKSGDGPACPSLLLTKCQEITILKDLYVCDFSHSLLHVFLLFYRQLEVQLL